MRIGCAEQTLLAALSQAAVYTEQHSKPPPEIQSPLEEAEKGYMAPFSLLAMIVIMMNFKLFLRQELDSWKKALENVPKAGAYYRYGAKIKPDVWFEASEVWEVKASDLTISPKYQAAAGIVDSKKGISRRMPRLVRF